MAEPPRVWALLGRRAGDNRQVLTLAEASGLPFEAKALRFNPGRALPTLLRRGSLHTLTLESRALIAPPWPDVVIASGKRTAPIALWIRMASGGRTRLAHVGRPWAPLSWFDLVVTTAQYGLPERPNVIRNALPLAHPPADAGAIPPDLAALPTPRLALLAGGSSRPLILDATAARRFVEAGVAQAESSGGALLVATSPRTGAGAVRAIRETLADARVPYRLSVFGEGENAYRGFLAAADAFLVTEDSAAMAAEAAMTGRPVAIHPLPRRPDAWMRVVLGFRAAMGLTPWTRRLFDALVAWGAVTSIRDIGAFAGVMAREGLLDGGPAARDRAAQELEAAAAAVRRLADAARDEPRA